MPPVQQALIGRHQRRIMNQCACDDESVGRIIVQACQIQGPYGNCSIERQLERARCQDGIPPIRDRNRKPKPAPRLQQAHFPERDGRNGNLADVPHPVDQRPGLASELAIAGVRPYEYVRVQHDHLIASHSSVPIGDTMS